MIFVVTILWNFSFSGVGYLLEADGVCLRLAVLTQVELFVKLLGKMAVTSLSEQRHLGVELHPALKDVLNTHATDHNSTHMANRICRVLRRHLWWAIFGDADVIGGDSFDASVFVEQNLPGTRDKV